MEVTVLGSGLEVRREQQNRGFSKHLTGVQLQVECFLGPLRGRKSPRPLLRLSYIKNAETGIQKFNNAFHMHIKV